MSVSNIIPYEDKALIVNEDIPIIAEGTTSVCTLAHVDGCLMFRKTLKREFVDKEVYRTAFKKEYEAGSKIENPYIVGYNKLVCEANDVSLYLDFIEGRTLKEALVAEPEWFVVPDNLHRFLKQLLCGMRCLHEHQLVHLDLNTSNIMLTKVNHDVKIIDLGYCYSSVYPSAVGTTSGFGAPELFEDLKSVDSRADIYSFGKIIECICNEIKPLCKRREVNRLIAIAERCSMSNPDDRYRSVEDVEKAILQAFSRKNQLGWIISFVLISLFLLALFFLLRVPGTGSPAEVLPVDSISEQSLKQTIALRADTVADTVVVKDNEFSADALKDDTTQWRKPKHSFPFPAVVDDRKRIYVKILPTDDLSKIPLVMKMVSNVDVHGYQINVVLPDSTCEFLVGEYNRLICENISKRAKQRAYIVRVNLGSYILLSRVSDDYNRFEKNIDDIAKFYFDGSSLEEGKYTIRFYDGIVTPYEIHPTHFITDEIILNFEISNGAVKSQNKFF